MIKTKQKRKYDLPKYVCYDMAESRNREKHVFQTQVRHEGKILKNNLYSVKEAMLWVMNTKLNVTKEWSLCDAGNYLLGYKPEMDTFKYIMSDTPKSPSVRKYQKIKAPNIRAEDYVIINDKTYKLVD